MNKILRATLVGIFTFGLLSADVPSLYAGKLGTVTAQTTDLAGIPRTSFSSSERMGLSVLAQNTATSANNIQFTFEVKDPNGSRRLYQTGNSAPGSVIGTARSSLSGISVGQFYTSPGQYTLTVTATLDGESVQASSNFTVFSPLITLTYPPNGAHDLIDQPLIFRWVSSGASIYRVYVDIDTSFYKKIFVQDVATNFLAYPLMPSDERQRLSAGQTYYWKVEGLDAFGNVVAKTDTPFSFTVKSQSAQSSSRDLAIVNMQRVSDSSVDSVGALPLGVFVKNQGGKSESNVPVSMYVDGAAVPSSPKKITMIAPGETVRLVFPVRPPDEERPVVAMANIDFFDDNPQNNRFTMNLSRDDRKEKQRMTPSQAWETIKRSITDPSILSELEGYSIDSIEGDGISSDQVERALQDLKAGKAKIKDMQLKD